MTTLDPKKRGTEAESFLRRMRQLIAGQGEAIEEIANIYQLYLTGMTPGGRPLGNFLFLGPTGCGKTRVVEATAECLVGNPKAVVKIDCGEFQHSHEIAKLIGSPPGYLGHRETHPMLSQETIDRYHTETVKISFVLFDEIEKASDALWNLLLGILDKGILTLGDNRKVDFSRAMIFMTGNIGAGEMAALLNPRLGFGVVGRKNEPRTSEDSNALNGKVSRVGMEAARRKFTPEFMNRIDKVVVFHPLGATELKRIVGIELSAIQQRIFNSVHSGPFLFTMSDAGKQFLLDEGTDERYGARHLKRAIERLLVQPLSNLVASDQVRGGDMVSIDHESGADVMTFRLVREGLAAEEVAQASRAAAAGAGAAEAVAEPWYGAEAA